jgi:hypothetical protein
VGVKISSPPDGGGLLALSRPFGGCSSTSRTSDALATCHSDMAGYRALQGKTNLADFVQEQRATIAVVDQLASSDVLSDFLSLGPIA